MKKIYQEVTQPTLPDDLKSFLTEYATATGKTENAIMREWIDELQAGEISIDDLKKLSF